MRVVSLTAAELHRLRGVFEEEVGCWRSQLHWDYRPSTQLIRRHVSSQSLPGFVLRDGPGQAAGYVYYVSNPPVGFIGNLFVRQSNDTLLAYQMLFDQAFLALRSWKGVQRIESQLFPFYTSLEPIFRAAGFEVRKRYFLSLQLDRLVEAALPPPGSLPVRICPWRSVHFNAAAAVIYDSYSDSPDHELCFDYQSLEGCGRFLRNIIDNPGCGQFRPQSSQVALDGRGEVCAILITSRISSSTGMIPQVSVRRDWQGRGIGSHLLRLYFTSARRHGFKRIALSVSEANQKAYKLYKRLGFNQERSFQAYVWTADETVKKAVGFRL